MGARLAAALWVLVASLSGGTGCDDRKDVVDDAGVGGSADADAPAGADATLTALQDAWCPTFAARFCAAAKPCGCLLVPGFSTTQACLERAERGCRDQLARFEGDARIVPASEVPAGCEPALQAALAACRLPAPELFAVQCPLVWPRDLSRDLPEASESCAEGLCADGTRCNAEGRCALPVAGAACSSDADCPEDQRCGEQGRCRAYALELRGEACGGPDACSGDAQCLASARRECREKAAGSACVDDSVCKAGEYCADDRCTTAPKQGEPCGNGVACAASLACRFAPGEGEGTCQALPTNGEPCALGTLGPFVCAAGLACRDRFCGAVPGEGEPCAVGDVRCEAGLGCHVEGVDSVCRARLPVGESCQLDDSCSAGSFCDFGVSRCTAFFAAGETCTDGNECGPEGACVPDATGAFRCVSQPGLGEACFLDQCEAGLACRSPFDAGVCAPPLCAAFAF